MAKTAICTIKDPVAVHDPAVKQARVIRPGDQFPADAPIVQANTWAFDETNTPDVTGPVEAATANPGEKRVTKRPQGR